MGGIWSLLARWVGGAGVRRPVGMVYLTLYSRDLTLTLESRDLTLTLYSRDLTLTLESR